MLKRKLKIGLYAFDHDLYLLVFNIIKTLDDQQLLEIHQIKDLNRVQVDLLVVIQQQALLEVKQSYQGVYRYWDCQHQNHQVCIYKKIQGILGGLKLLEKMDS